jgi:hypothetical protein
MTHFVLEIGFPVNALFYLEVIWTVRKTPGMIRHGVIVAWQLDRGIGRQKQMLQLSVQNMVTKNREIE